MLRYLGIKCPYDFYLFEESKQNKSLQSLLSPREEYTNADFTDFSVVISFQKCFKK